MNRSFQTVLDDGTELKVTVETTGELSDEDRAFIRRFLPVGAEIVLEQVAPDQGA